MKLGKTASIFKVLLTCICAILAGLVIWRLYLYYTYAPQTRDGKIRADVVPIASDISGRVDGIYVADNQKIHKGDLLFSIDKERLSNAVAKAKAVLENAKVNLDAAKHEEQRYERMNFGVVSKQEIDNRKTTADRAKATYNQAKVNLDLAKLNLQRADVYAPVNGIVTNFTLKRGIYANVGKAVMTIVDTDSFYVVGYFEETKLKNLHVGMKASIHPMGEDADLEGHITGLSAGITDREYTTTNGTLLANINPSFNWVRLAQRIPVRISIDKIPNKFALVAGRTVSIDLEKQIESHE